ncbi:hypothetical protein DPEC_G00196680 [Dallia pectoralis]|uniref:Uncharacterized protein n=1 Tax=Dallia pectoralis TaxID=75939 RepID=A0ACC2G7P1_DALPE|nr:hypothetical protein DPEC_G00196680 [Dallia pectoralis]
MHHSGSPCLRLNTELPEADSVYKWKRPRPHRETREADLPARSLGRPVSNAEISPVYFVLFAAGADCSPGVYPNCHLG